MFMQLQCFTNKQLVCNYIMPCTNVSKDIIIQTHTGAQLPTSSIIKLTEMFAFCLSVSHFHKQCGEK